MPLPLIGALAGLGRLGVGAGRAVTGTTARRVGYGAALGDLATDAVVGAGKGLVGGLKGAMISEAPGLAGAYAFGKDLRKRANASRGNASSPPPSSNKSSSSTPVIGGLGSLNTASLLVSQKQSNIINLEQVRQLKQLNDSVVNQSRLISYQIDDTRRKNQFTEEAANEQAIRDDKLLEAIRNIGSGGGGGKRGGGEAANDSSSGGFLSSLLGGSAGGAMSKLVPLLTGAMAALPWAKILKLAGPASLAVNTLSLRGSTPDKKTEEEQSDWYKSEAYKKQKAEELAAFEKEMFRKNDEAKAKRIAAGTAVEARPSDYVAGKDENPGYTKNKSRARVAEQEDWDKKNAKRYANDGELKTAAKPPMPPSAVTVPPVATAPAPKGPLYRIPATGRVSSLQQDLRDLGDGQGAKPHNGVDYEMEVGSSITPIRPGKVDSFDKDGKTSLGRYVIIDHEDGIKSTYGHLSEVTVHRKEQPVNENTLLGLSGGAKTDKGAGRSTNPHLHLEVKQGEKFLKVADLPGLEASGKLLNQVSRGTNTAANNTTAPAPAATSPASMAAPHVLDPLLGAGKPLNIVKSSAVKDNKPLVEFYKQNAANINVIKKRDDAIAESKSIKTRLIASLKDKSLQGLTSLKAQGEGPPAGFPGQVGQLDFYGLIPSDKAEVLKAIDEEIKKKTVPAVVSKSDALVGKEFAGSGLDSPLLANASRNIQADPNASVTAFLGGVLPAGQRIPYSKEADRLGGVSAAVVSSGTKTPKDETVNTYDARLNEQFAEFKAADGDAKVEAKQIASTLAYQGNILKTSVLPKFKPEFKSNSEIIEDANKAFLKELRSTLTGIFNKGLTEALLPNGPGVSASQAGRDDMYRGEQLKQINDTSKKINEGAVKLFGDKFGPMFAPMLDKLSTSYFEVGSRAVGKAIFQSIGGLDAKDTMTLTGQVLGNYAAGKKELAFEQLLYGASGGKDGGIALGTETLFAKYGFKDPMEGISYFANALGEKATQYTGLPALMGANDRSKSLTFEPRSGKYINNDTGKYATQPEIDAANKDYGSRVSQTPMFDPSINNFGTAGAPYTTTAGQYGNIPGGITNNALRAGGGSMFQQGVKPTPETTRSQFFGITAQAQAIGGERLIAQQNTQYRAEIERDNLRRDETRKFAEAAAKRDYKIADERAASQVESDAARTDYDKAMSDAERSAAHRNSTEEINAIDRLSGKKGDGSDVAGLKPRDGRKSGQLFDSNVYDKDGKIVGSDSMKEIGNFGFDMLKNYAGQELTKDIKNPYAQMVANFAIQKGLNYGVDALLGKTGETGLLEKGFSYVVDNAPSWLERGISLYTGSARGGPITGPGSGTSDSIPTMLSNGEFVINAKAAKENMALLTAINESGLTTGKPQGFNKGGPVKGGGTLSDKLSGFLSSIGVTGEGLAAYEAKQSSQVVSSSGVYNGFSMSKAADGTTVVDKPGYYDTGKSISAFGKSVHAFGGPLAGFIPGQGILGGVAQLIGGLMTAPFDRQSDFWGDMDAGTGGKAGAVSIGNGNYAMMDGNVFDRSGTLVGGTVVDGSGRAVTTGSGGTLGFGVGPSGAAQIASNMSSISESSQNSMAGSDVGPSPGADGVPFASGGHVAGPGSARSDSIPAMLSNGEFVVNALATKKYRPLLDAINALDVKHLEGGTASGSGESVATLSKVLGTNETNSQLAISNETLTSIDGSLRTISGRSTTGSGTAISRTGSGLGFDTGLGAFGGPASGGLGGNQVMGTANGRGGRSAPSTMDIIGNVAANVAKGYLVKAGITAVTGGMMGSLGAVLPSMYGAYSFAGGGMAGIAAAAESGIALTSMAIAEGAAAIGSALSSAGTFLMTNPVGWIILGGLVLFSIYGGGGGGSRPPPKEPKFHAAMYVSGNNNPNAIAPIYETTDYHAVPDNYKTIAYGLLRVAFNATKASEAVTKIPSPWDWLYIKIQFDRMSLIWGKGAPPKQSLLADTYPENMSWAAPDAGMNLNTVASDIIDRITKEFKTNLAAADANLAKLDTAAIGLKNYSLDELSSGLIDELKSGKLKLDSTIQKGIYANDVAESNRISALILAASHKPIAETENFETAGGDYGGTYSTGTTPAQIWSMKDNKYVNASLAPAGAILLDAQGKPVYDIEGTSAGLTIDDFVSAEKAGTRTANILAPPATAGSGGGGGGATVIAPSVVNNDASSFINYYATNNDTIDGLRKAQTG